MTDQIRVILKEIWTENIRDDYDKALIVSESSLMSAFYHYLRIALPKMKGFTAYTEPTFWWNGDKDSSNQQKPGRYKPDLMIGQEIGGNKCRAAALIEFKCKPYYRPTLEGDINKLGKIAKLESAYGEMMDPGTGKACSVIGKNLHIDSQTLLAFAVIGQEGSPACKKFDINFNRDRFLHFTGLIKKDGKHDFGMPSYE
jgi:hypothetical protein